MIKWNSNPESPEKNHEKKIKKIKNTKKLLKSFQSEIKFMDVNLNYLIQ